MNTLVAAGNHKRVLFAVLMVALLATIFWTQSRYPALDEKAMMSGAIQLEDPLSFEAKYPVTADMPLLRRIWLSTLNWIHTNKKGMTFGVFIAAAFLTLFGYLQKRSFAGGFSNSVFGMVMGAPLGVCVNCAAPIARGLYAGGLRAETTLSAMIASPTLNIVVLTMLFSLLPVYMALAKIGLSIFVILVAVPLICRMLPGEQLQVAQVNVPAATGWDLDAPTEGAFQALAGFVANYGKNLWFIIKMTVPLMFLAGLLGATAGQLLPQDMILGLGFSLGVVLLVAVVGTFLPVPIAFDVVVAGALLSGGLEHGYVFALLFTLGSFSVYSYLIVGATISWRAASLLGAVIFVLGALGGTATHYYHTWQTDRALEMLLGFERALLPAAHAAEGQFAVTSDRPVTVEARPFAARSAAGDTPFERLDAWHIGIDKPIEFSMKDMWPPFWEGRSLSTGDIDHDGDIDLVIASTEVGLYLYDNDGTGQFSRIAADLGALGALDIFNAVLVDIDNDGWLDLFIATYRDGNMVIRNDQGQFDFATLLPVANRDDAMLSLALSFGDADGDGDLDAAIGNWAAGWYRRIPGEESRNRVVFNEGGVMDGSRFKELSGLPGETLSILLSDIDVNGTADLLVGNDFELPDYIYYGDGKGGFTPITRADGIVPHTTNTTMSIRTGDLHNDGMPELYFAQIAGRSSGVSNKLKMQRLDAYCDGIERDTDRAVCSANMAIKDWYKSGNRFDPTYASKCQQLAGALQAECKAMLVKDLAIQKGDASLCALIPAGQDQAKAYCDIHFRPSTAPLMDVVNTTIPQIMRANVLLTRDGNVYADTAGPEGLEVGGWSWDVKIADFDNDGWQDVYIVNGTWVPNEVSPSNLFFRNNGDGTFTEASGPFGLEDYLMTAVAVAFDMDNDGDLDVIAQPVNGPVALFRNGAQDGQALAVELRDRAGNSHGIGARIYALMPDGTEQMRELQVGGGFMSFDAPVAHFGLGQITAIDGLRIVWPDGAISRVAGPVPAGATYRVIRN